MHANDHMSMAVVYRCKSISSGARYQRVTTCDVICLVTFGKVFSAPADTCRVSACSAGHFQVNGLNSTTADRCDPCNDMSTRPSVDYCNTCADASVETCSEAACAPGYHTYDVATQSCSPCTTVQYAHANVNYSCTSALDSRIDKCSSGYYIVPAQDETSHDECAPCHNMQAPYTRATSVYGTQEYSVASCDVCDGSNPEDCIVGICAAGYHTFDVENKHEQNDD